MKKYIKPIVRILCVQTRHNMLVGSNTLGITNESADVNNEILSKEDKDSDNGSLFGW